MDDLNLISRCKNLVSGEGQRQIYLTAMETLSKRDSLRKGDLLQVKYTEPLWQAYFFHPAC